MLEDGGGGGGGGSGGSGGDNPGETPMNPATPPPPPGSPPDPTQPFYDSFTRPTTADSSTNLGIGKADLAALTSLTDQSLILKLAQAKTQGNLNAPLVIDEVMSKDSFTATSQAFQSRFGSYDNYVSFLKGMVDTLVKAGYTNIILTFASPQAVTDSQKACGLVTAFAKTQQVSYGMECYSNNTGAGAKYYDKRLQKYCLEPNLVNFKKAFESILGESFVMKYQSKFKICMDYGDKDPTGRQKRQDAGRKAKKQAQQYWPGVGAYDWGSGKN
jgi:hypothetical protein